MNLKTHDTFKIAVIQSSLLFGILSIPVVIIDQNIHQMARLFKGFHMLSIVLTKIRETKKLFNADKHRYIKRMDTNDDAINLIWDRASY
jgi:hypothetical protein